MKSTLPLFAIFALASGTQAASVINWVTTNGDALFTGGSAATNSPVTTDATADTIVGSFTSTTLSLGQTLLVTGQFNISGSGNVVGGQFRIGAFESTGGTPAPGVGTNYVGAWVNDPVANQFATTNGSATNPFSGSAIVDVFDGPPAGATAMSKGTTYNFTVSLTRLAANDLTVAVNYNDGGSYDWSGSHDLTTFGPSGSFTFDSVGFLMGGTLAGTAATFTNINADVVPEPSSAALLGLGGLALLLRRRK